MHYEIKVGWDSSDGLAIRCELGGQGIESLWGRHFPYPSRPALGPTHPLVQWVPHLIPGVERSGRDINYPPLSSAYVKEKVKLYLHFPFGPSWLTVGRNLLSLLI
jgi:hypothetical protein